MRRPPARPAVNQSVSSVVLPNPAGADTSVSADSPARPKRSISLERATKPRRRVGTRVLASSSGVVMTHAGRKQSSCCRGRRVPGPLEAVEDHVEPDQSSSSISSRRPDRRREASIVRHPANSMRGRRIAHRYRLPTRRTAVPRSHIPSSGWRSEANGGQEALGTGLRMESPSALTSPWVKAHLGGHETGVSDTGHTRVTTPANSESRALAIGSAGASRAQEHRTIVRH